MEMTQAHADRLWAALEGGEFTQVAGTLRKVLPGGEFSHCCLGVVTVLHADEEDISWETVDGDTLFYPKDLRSPGPGYDSNTTSATCLIKKLQDKFNCIEAGFMVPYRLLTEEEKFQVERDNTGFATEVSAMGLNDAGVSFKRIAELGRQCVTIIDNYKDRNVLKPGITE